MAKKFLLEIGVEDLPARFINPSLAQLETKFNKLLADARLKAENVKISGTPRRLIITADGIPEKQDDLNQEFQGPAVAVAFDKDGNPTKAAIGFAKGKGLEVSQLVVKETPRGKCVFASAMAKGEPTKAILEKGIPEILSTLEFPKSMVWNSSKTAFARPVRWLVAMLDNEFLKFSFAEISSGDFTYGHRFRAANKKIKVTSIEDFFKALSANFVMFDREERKSHIVKTASALAAKAGGRIIEDPDLLDQVVNLVEYPEPVIGKIDPKYMTIPKEILTTTMSVHQRYFPVENNSGELLPYFIVTSNSDPENADNILKGNYKVLQARLEDAKFFYENDIKAAFDSFAEKLKDIVFQVKLGTVADKVERIGALSAFIAAELDLSETDTKNILETARVCKNDLVSAMICEKEYTKLQGLMGYYYALKSGKPENVAKGIFEHYLPRYPGDIMPETLCGQVTGIADKIDTIVGIIGVDMIPTGSQDIFALRRAGNGIIKVIYEKSLNLNLARLIDKALSLLSGRLVLPGNEVSKHLNDFFRQRLDTYLKDQGFPYDTLNSVLNTADFLSDVFHLREKATVIETIKKTPEFSTFLTGSKRIENITKNNSVDARVNESLLSVPEEKALYSAFEKTGTGINRHLERFDYSSVMKDFISLTPAINAFFDKVLVMDKDPAIKSNRLALLTEIKKCFGKVAVFSEIAETQATRQ